MEEYLFHAYNDMQRRYFIDSQMLYQTYIEKLLRYKNELRYGMFWQKSKGNEYLVKAVSRDGKRKYLGRRNADTERIYHAFIERRNREKASLATLKNKLAEVAKINKAVRLARLPADTSKILHKINQLGLNDKFIIIGTFSLYAYEAMAGIFIEERHLSTFDIDILNRRAKNISVYFKEEIPTGSILELFQSIDPTFELNPKASYQVINASGVRIDFINPINRTGPNQCDIIELEINGIEWLQNCRLISETVIDTSGRPCVMTVLHPLDFSIYKRWLSEQPSREPIKRERDAVQSDIVREIIRRYLPHINIEEELKKRKQFPKRLIGSYKS